MAEQAEFKSLEDLALRRGSMVAALHDALEDALGKASDTARERLAERAEELATSVEGGATRNVESSIWETLINLYLSSGRTLKDGKEREVYVSIQCEFDDEGTVLRLATRTNTGGQADARTKKSLSFNWKVVRNSARKMLREAGTEPPGEFASAGLDNHLMWESQVRYLDPDDQEAFQAVLDAHLDCLPTVVRAYENVVEKVLPA